jgi:hypothetical protein
MAATMASRARVTIGVDEGGGEDQNDPGGKRNPRRLDQQREENHAERVLREELEMRLEEIHGYRPMSEAISVPP